MELWESLEANETTTRYVADNIQNKILISRISSIFVYHNQYIFSSNLQTKA